MVSARGETDVLIVGAGVAGLTVAAACAATGLRVTVVCAGPVGVGNSWLAQGGIAVAAGPDDNPGDHMADTLAAGAGLCDLAAVAALCIDGISAVRAAMARGVTFDTDVSGAPLRTREGAHRRARILHAGGDATGRRVTQALRAHVEACAGVRVLAETRVLELWQPEGRRGTPVRGAWLADAAGSCRLMRARVVVLASGGLGGLLAPSTNPDVTAGDGMALAWLAGADLADLEFIQFHPTVLHAAGRPPLLLTEALRGEGAYLVDADGRRFMPDQHEAGELAPRDIVARAIDAVRRRDARGVFLDARHLGAPHLRRRFPTVVATLGAAGFDVTAEPVPVAPAAHYTMGGVRTDIDGRVAGVPGLWAAGEVACSGLHGANRLASNSLLECLVFGERVALAMQHELPPPAQARTGCAPVSGRIRWWPGLAEILSGAAPTPRGVADLLGLRRSGAGLAQAVQQWSAVLLADESAWLEVDAANLRAEQISGRNRTIVVGAIARMAQARCESRGAHWRADFPEPREEWVLHQVLRGSELLRYPVLQEVRARSTPASPRS